MRSALAVTAFAVLLGAATAQAEKRTFVIVNDSDGYGIDRCLASGARCGSAAATAYCRAHEYSQAVSFRKVEKNEITGVVPASDLTCRGGACDEFVAIECAR